jgi:hypothetical protein
VDVLKSKSKHVYAAGKERERDEEQASMLITNSFKVLNHCAGHSSGLQVPSKCAIRLKNSELK